ncbi:MULTISPECIES: hypothetical protein [Rhizobium/Agrobacterium group]|uniref:hypothetical protein n=1 Tax=Rhizobium/Agrobacterium group TaxID=227290 RepID=UPI000B3F6539|nr:MULTISPECIES: hypothetical protein [Rhizobium/Agrobacterium group]MCF1484516.1 hypothetical protein [Allorhizobium ampelinum]NSZ43176.1 hypothetical protein [Agrobacterium vitis]NTA26833.1 hypothetical protein [Allorhizobium ampelinum]OVE94658.1 hypothetical protein B7W85_10040 [Allorhizobium ampelinum]
MYDPLADFVRIERSEGSKAALDYLDEKERQTADPELLHHIRYARIMHLHSQGRYDEAIDATREFLPEISCKTAAYMEIALALYRKGEREAAEEEIAKAPLDAERERYGPLVYEAEFFLLFLRNQRGIPASTEESSRFPSDYRQVTDRGMRHGLEVLGREFQGMEY